MADAVRLALVNDQPLFVRGLELLLPAVSEGRVRVVASTDDASLASGMVRRHRPDIAVVDLAVPEPGGLRAIAAIRRAEPDIPVLAMSDRVGDEAASGEGRGAALASLRSGAIGFLCKTAEPEDLVAPLLAAAEGWTVVPRWLLNNVLAQRPGRPSATAVLDDEQRRLWRLIASGHSVPQISRELHVSERTTKRLTAALLRRLQVRTRTEAATLAGRSGLLDD